MAPPLATAALAALALAAPPDLRTTAERTGFEETGRYDEAVELCRAYATAFPGRAACSTFGRTPEGRPLVALVASEDGALTPRAARGRGRPVVLFQGGIHAGEIDGKDAGFILLRELLSRRGGPLAAVTAVFVPVLNADGHEHFGPLHRPNQRGPREAGWRTNAANLNLNRDYMKSDAPEIRAVEALLAAWDPIVYADLHVTDGAQFQPDVSVTLEPRLGYAEALRPIGRAISTALLEGLSARHHEPLDFYPSFVKDGDPRSGFAYGVPPPRFAHGYWAAHGRFGVLLETHSWKTYPERVATTVDFLRLLLELAARDGRSWVAAARSSDAAGAQRGGDEVALAYGPGTRVRTLEFPGYAYVWIPSPALGRDVVRYDELHPEIWRIPLVEDVVPTATATLPRAGWIVPAGWAAQLGPRLRRLHGVRTVALSRSARAVPGAAYTVAKLDLTRGSYEGRQLATVAGSWAPARAKPGAGDLFVPVAQPRALLAALLLEPGSPDAFLSWGELNAAFEEKEYVEDYLLAPFADALLERDAAVRAEFERRLADPAFANDPEARAEFFYRRHPAHDLRVERYPVLRVDEDPR
jgi:hypothetical protein